MKTTIIEKLNNIFVINDSTREMLGRILIKEFHQTNPKNEELEQKRHKEILTIAWHFHVPQFDRILSAYELLHGKLFSYESDL